MLLRGLVCKPYNVGYTVNTGQPLMTGKHLKDFATMKTSVNFCDFVDAFRAYDRYDQFGYEALQIIFNYLEEYEASIGEEIELDVVAICCDFTVEHYSDIAENYGIELDPEDDEQKHIQQVKAFLETETIMLGQTEDQCNIVYQAF
jgi:hypothetical protein